MGCGAISDIYFTNMMKQNTSIEVECCCAKHMESGMMGNFGLNGDSNVKNLGEFLIYGTKGVLRLGDANLFGERVTFIPNDHNIEHWQLNLSEILEEALSCIRVNFKDDEK